MPPDYNIYLKYGDDNEKWGRKGVENGE